MKFKFKKLFTFLFLLFVMFDSAFATETKFAKVVFVGDLGCGKTSILVLFFVLGCSAQAARSSGKAYIPQLEATITIDA